MKFIKLLALIIVLIPFQAWSNNQNEISLNFTDIETNKVLKIIADFSGKGLVLPDSKLGVTTVYLKDVPWEEALRAVALSENLNVEITDKLIIISQKKCSKTTVLSSDKK